ncbi:30S ribosomal protein S11 [Candidatus Giovannonibacteria bacterium]|nr:30S ribosomal protein S11 [Candidatus Giovannonibacteria bacterium]
MGKKRIIQKSESGTDTGAVKVSVSSKKKLMEGVVHIQSTYNNTLIAITDDAGNVVTTSSAGSLGFSGAKKGTPYAATKVAEFLGEKAKAMGVKDIKIFMKGVGAGRESALRSFAAQGFNINAIRDITPIPHNGPRPPKPRRV